MVNPLSPAEAKAAHLHTLPGEVIKAVNDRLVRAGDASKIIIRQNELVDELAAMGFDRDILFRDHLLDFEDLFRERGWNVVYDKPGYNETYSAYWTFTAPQD